MTVLIALSLLQAAPMVADGRPIEVAQASGPLGTSGDQRFDTVGYAGIVGADGGAGVSVASEAIPMGSYVEITALDSGRTIVALVSGRGVSRGDLIDLSAAAARLLGVSGAATGVRVRTVSPIVQDQVALRAGNAASPRIDAPDVLLVALRKRLPVVPVVKVASAKPVEAPKPLSEKVAKVGPAPAHSKADAAATKTPAAEAKHDHSVAKAPDAKPAAKPTPTVDKSAKGEGWYVQAAALSSHDRAQALANTLGGGRVVSVKNVHRVQIGPFATQALATRARDGIVRRGYGGASVIRSQ